MHWNFSFCNIYIDFLLQLPQFTCVHPKVIHHFGEKKHSYYSPFISSFSRVSSTVEPLNSKLADVLRGMEKLEDVKEIRYVIRFCYISE